LSEMPEFFGDAMFAVSLAIQLWLPIAILTF
jgi:hypothetical protein